MPYEWAMLNGNLLVDNSAALMDGSGGYHYNVRWNYVDVGNGVIIDPHVGFYRNPPPNAKCRWSTNNGEKTPMTFHKGRLTMPNRDLYLWSDSKLKTVADGYKERFWGDLKSLQRPNTFLDLYEFFDSATLWYAGAYNLWNLMNMLVTEAHQRWPAVLSYWKDEVEQWVHGLLYKWEGFELNQHALKQWDGRSDPLVDVPFNEMFYANVGFDELGPQETSILRDVLIIHFFHLTGTVPCVGPPKYPYYPRPFDNLSPAAPFQPEVATSSATSSEQSSSSRAIVIARSGSPSQKSRSSDTPKTDRHPSNEEIRSSPEQSASPASLASIPEETSTEPEPCSPAEKAETPKEDVTETAKPKAKSGQDKQLQGPWRLHHKSPPAERNASCPPYLSSKDASPPHSNTNTGIPSSQHMPTGIPSNLPSLPHPGMVAGLSGMSPTPQGLVPFGPLPHPVANMGLSMGHAMPFQNQLPMQHPPMGSQHPNQPFQQQFGFQDHHQPSRNSNNNNAGFSGNHNKPNRRNSSVSNGSRKVRDDPVHGAVYILRDSGSRDGLREPGPRRNSNADRDRRPQGPWTQCRNAELYLQPFPSILKQKFRECSCPSCDEATRSIYVKGLTVVNMNMQVTELKEKLLNYFRYLNPISVVPKKLCQEAMVMFRHENDAIRAVSDFQKKPDKSIRGLSPCADIWYPVFSKYYFQREVFHRGPDSHNDRDRDSISRRQSQSKVRQGSWRNGQTDPVREQMAPLHQPYLAENMSFVPLPPVQHQRTLWEPTSVKPPQRSGMEHTFPPRTERRHSQAKSQSPRKSDSPQKAKSSQELESRLEELRTKEDWRSKPPSEEAMEAEVEEDIAFTDTASTHSSQGSRSIVVCLPSPQNAIIREKWDVTADEQYNCEVVAKVEEVAPREVVASSEVITTTAASAVDEAITATKVEATVQVEKSCASSRTVTPEPREERAPIVTITESGPLANEEVIEQKTSADETMKATNLSTKQIEDVQMTHPATGEDLERKSPVGGMVENAKPLTKHVGEVQTISKAAGKHIQKKNKHKRVPTNQSTIPKPAEPINDGSSGTSTNGYRKTVTDLSSAVTAVWLPNDTGTVIRKTQSRAPLRPDWMAEAQKNEHENTKPNTKTPDEESLGDRIRKIARHFPEESPHMENLNKIKEASIKFKETKSAQSSMEDEPTTGNDGLVNEKPTSSEDRQREREQCDALHPTVRLALELDAVKRTSGEEELEAPSKKKAKHKKEGKSQGSNSTVIATPSGRHTPVDVQQRDPSPSTSHVATDSSSRSPSPAMQNHQSAQSGKYKKKRKSNKRYKARSGTGQTEGQAKSSGSQDRPGQGTTTEASSKKEFVSQQQQVFPEGATAMSSGPSDPNGATQTINSDIKTKKEGYRAHNGGSLRQRKTRSPEKARVQFTPQEHGSPSKRGISNMSTIFEPSKSEEPKSSPAVADTNVGSQSTPRSWHEVVKNDDPFTFTGEGNAAATTEQDWMKDNNTLQSPKKQYEDSSPTPSPEKSKKTAHKRTASETKLSATAPLFVSSLPSSPAPSSKVKLNPSVPAFASSLPPSPARSVVAIDDKAESSSLSAKLADAGKSNAIAGFKVNKKENDIPRHFKKPSLPGQSTRGEDKRFVTPAEQIVDPMRITQPGAPWREREVIPAATAGARNSQNSNHIPIKNPRQIPSVSATEQNSPKRAHTRGDGAATPATTSTNVTPEVSKDGKAPPKRTNTMNTKKKTTPADVLLPPSPPSMNNANEFPTLGEAAAEMKQKRASSIGKRGSSPSATMRDTTTAAAAPPSPPPSAITAKTTATATTTTARKAGKGEEDQDGWRVVSTSKKGNNSSSGRAPSGRGRREGNWRTGGGGPFGRGFGAGDERKGG